MKTYAIRYLDALGRTLATRSLAFDDNRLAIDFARIGLISHDIVEVWADEAFVVRLHRDGRPESVPEARRSPAVAELPVEPRQALDEWDNEGGGTPRAT